MKNLRIQTQTDCIQLDNHKTTNTVIKYNVCRDFTDKELASFITISPENVRKGIIIESFNSSKNAKIFMDAINAKREHKKEPVKITPIDVDKKGIVINMILLEIERCRQGDELYYGSQEAEKNEYWILEYLRVNFGFNYEQDEKLSEFALKSLPSEIWQYYLDNIIPTLNCITCNDTQDTKGK